MSDAEHALERVRNLLQLNAIDVPRTGFCVRDLDLLGGCDPRYSAV